MATTTNRALAGAGIRGRLARLRRRHWEAVLGLLFISPWIVKFAWLQLYPMGASLVYSFTSYNMMQAPVYVGLANYSDLFTQDPLFWKAVVNTTLYTVCSVPLDLLVAFLFAILLNRNMPGRGAFRSAFYLPAVLPTVALSIVWIMVLNTRGGIVNDILGLAGLPAIPWLTSPNWALPSLIFVSMWTVGPMFVVFLAGLQDVPQEVYESARIDGASRVRTVWHITIPLISPIILFNTIIGLIGAMQIFTQPLVLFRTSTELGGPLNSALMYSVQLYQVAFSQLRMGYASAMAWLLFVVVFGFTMLAMLLSRRVVHYE
jgi:multiple sugar transport system permease protein